MLKNLNLCKYVKICDNRPKTAFEPEKNCFRILQNFMVLVSSKTKNF